MKKEEINELLKSYELLTSKIENFFNSFIEEYQGTPIIEVKSRVKTVDSVLDKLLKKEYTLNEIKKLTDIAGIRIVSRVNDDIYKLVCVLRELMPFKIVEERDYIRETIKESGYKAYHLIVESDGMFAEIQILTYAMKLFADIEHSVIYKCKYNILVTDEIKEKLKYVAGLAEEFDFIYGMIYKLYYKRAKGMDDDGTFDSLKTFCDQTNAGLMLNIKDVATSVLVQIRIEIEKIRRSLEEDEFE